MSRKVRPELWGRRDVPELLRGSVGRQGPLPASVAAAGVRSGARLLRGISLRAPGHLGPGLLEVETLPMTQPHVQARRVQSCLDGQTAASPGPRPPRPTERPVRLQARSALRGVRPRGHVTSHTFTGSLASTAAVKLPNQPETHSEQGGWCGLCTSPPGGPPAARGTRGASVAPGRPLDQDSGEGKLV